MTGFVNGGPPQQGRRPVFLDGNGASQIREGSAGMTGRLAGVLDNALDIDTGRKESDIAEFADILAIQIAAQPGSEQGD